MIEERQAGPDWLQELGQRQREADKHLYDFHTLIRRQSQELERAEPQRLAATLRQFRRDAEAAFAAAEPAVERGAPAHLPMLRSAWAGHRAELTAHESAPVPSAAADRPSGRRLAMAADPAADRWEIPAASVELSDAAIDAIATLLIDGHHRDLAAEQAARDAEHADEFYV